MRPCARRSPRQCDCAGRLAAALAAALLAAGCAGDETTAPRSEPASGGAPRPFTITVRDLLAEDEPVLADVRLLVDGTPRADSGGDFALELAPGEHTLAVERAGYRSDLFALRFAGEPGARFQLVGAPEAVFDLDGERSADLLLVPDALDVRYLRSLLDGETTYRWPARVDLHIDRSPTRAGFTLSQQQADSLAAFVGRALEELTDGAARLGRVTTGTGLDWKDFLNAERPGAITLQVEDLAATWAGLRAVAWTIYRRDPDHRGTIRSANVIVDTHVVAVPLRDFSQIVGHELGHALSLRHPLACRHWSRMDPALATCEPRLTPDVAPPGYWGRADLAAGKILYTFLPGTSFARLPETPPSVDAARREPSR